jgi:LCP family protein required for cell wall assembly
MNRAAGIARHGRLPRKHPVRTAVKVVAGVAAVALASSASIAAIAAGQVTTDLGPGVKIQGQPQGNANRVSLADYSGGFNMLVVGTDNDPDQGTTFGVRDATLNDVNILIHVSADHTNATAVSIPRDLVVPIPACEKADGSGSYSAMSAQPINNAWSYGGLSCVVQTVQSLTGVDVQYSAAVSFNGVIEMSNAIGGVPVCVNRAVKDRFTGLDLPAGTSTLQGDQALAFLRTRHGVGDGSDLGRISSQQVFLSSMLRTIKSNDTLGSLPRLYKLARAATSNMKLSESLNNVQTMVQMGRALQHLSLDQVNFVQYPGSTEGTGVYAGKVQPSTALAKQLFDKIQADQSFSLAAGSTGVGSEASAEAGQTPSQAASAPADAGSADAGSAGAGSAPTDAASAPAGASSPSASATPDTITGLQGQSASEQTCSVAYKY